MRNVERDDEDKLENLYGEVNICNAVIRHAPWSYTIDEEQSGWDRDTNNLNTRHRTIKMTLKLVF